MPKFNGNEKATITSVSSMVATLLVIFYGVKTVCCISSPHGANTRGAHSCQRKC